MIVSNTACLFFIADMNNFLLFNNYLDKKFNYWQEILCTVVAGFNWLKASHCGAAPTLFTH